MSSIRSILLLRCNNQRKQRSQFFFYEGNSNIRFNITSPYMYDANGKLIYTQEQLDMRRKAEILKYIKPNEDNVLKNKYALLAKQSKLPNRLICNNYINVPTSSSDVPGPVIYLNEDPNVPLYKYFSDNKQFQFQDVKYDDFKRAFDLFPNHNVKTNNGIGTSVNTIILLNPSTSYFSFTFSFPICIQFECDYVVNNSNTDIVNINIGVYSARLDIFYSNSLVNSVNGVYRTSPTEISTDIARSTVTISMDLNNSETGKIDLSRYVGNVIFQNITMPTVSEYVSQYVYTCRLTVNLNYGEYNSNELSRSNTYGNNIGTIDQQNVTNVKYSPFINIDSESNENFNNINNCTYVMYTNELPSPTDPIVTNLPFVPLSITRA